MIVALLDYYVNFVYPVATLRLDGTDVDKKQFPTLICEKLVEEWAARLEAKAGSANAERLRREASDRLNEWTVELPGSVKDVYEYEVNFRECMPKKVLRLEVFHDGWSFTGKDPEPVPAQSLPTDGHAAKPLSIPVPVPSQLCFHIAVDGHAAGPFMEEKLLQMISTGQLTETTRVWKKGMPNWLTAGEVPELSGFFEMPPSLDDGPPPLD
jgi:hypothetical protein